MAMIPLPPDFKEFLKLLNDNDVEYLLVGGYAVGYHGYPRATADFDIWIHTTPQNAKKMIRVLRQFGFNVPQLSTKLFLEEDHIIRMGVPPIQIEIITKIDGVEFDECYQRRITDTINGIKVDIINLDDLKKNKKASGRHKDLNDLEYLP